jgi:hypothetical protein
VAIASLELTAEHCVLRALRAGTVRITAQLEDGASFEKEFTIVDTSAAAGICFEMARGDDPAHGPSRMRFECIAGFGHRVTRDVTADPRARWTSSDARVATWGEPAGMLIGHTDGDVEVGVEFLGHRASMALHLEGGVASSLRYFSSNRPTFVKGLYTHLWLSVAASSARFGIGEIPGLSIEADPPSSVEILRGAHGVCLKGLELGPVRLVTQLGAQRIEHRIVVVEAPVEMSEIYGQLSMRLENSIAVLWIGERSEVSVLLRLGDSVLDREHNVIWSSSRPEVLGIETSDTITSVVGSENGRATLRATCPGRGLVRELEISVEERPEIQWF